MPQRAQLRNAARTSRGPIYWSGFPLHKYGTCWHILRCIAGESVRDAQLLLW